MIKQIALLNIIISIKTLLLNHQNLFDPEFTPKQPMINHAFFFAGLLIPVIDLGFI